MDIVRYNEIKAEMPDSIRMKLDHIKRYLDEGKAAAMIGAGFSKNARMPETAEMKDWNTLGVEFYTRLYGEPTEKELRFQNPINLATQVEASFGRHELDDMIQQSLPDDVIVPSRLYVDLLNLGWHDIFTTNYDTLLERACLDADHPYTIVYNRDTLLYSLSPRIIKLHGSFPNIRPYIITEEDYRTYSQNYPEFVNTVRQSLIENLFCMIGFSGDDPNFKSWLGWLRDVMGKKIAPVYFISYDSNLHDARRKLLAAQNIEVLNLHDLHGIGGIQEAFDFFFYYLKNEHSTQWNARLHVITHKIEGADQIRRIIKEMATIRNGYPGWLILPVKHYEDFRDVRSDIIFWGNVPSLDGLEKKELIQLLYELKWRLEISMTPIGIDWYVKAIEDLSLDNEDCINWVIDLKLALLKHYREIGKEEEYEELTKHLKAHGMQMKPEQTRKFYYDLCLMASSRMEYEQLRTYLTNWHVYETDFVGAIWKAAMLMEADQRGEALNVLNRAGTQLRHTILSSQQESYFYRSCQIAIERAQFIYLREGELKKYTDCDYVNEMRSFKEKLREASGKQSVSKSHGYSVDDVKTTWNLGPSGYYETYLYPYRYYTLCEKVGMPAGIAGMPLNTQDHELMLGQWLKHNRYYPIGVLVRSCNNRLVSSVLNRHAMAQIIRDAANDYFDRFYDYVVNNYKLTDKFKKTHVFETCIPLLVRLCSKISSDRVKKMALLLIQLHGNYVANYEGHEMEYAKTVYQSLSADDMVEVLSLEFEQPISLTGYSENDLYIPWGWCEGVTFSSVAVQVAIDGLQNVDEKIQEAAFLRAYQILRGKICDADRERLMQIIRDWRNSTNQMQHVCFSLIDVPATEEEKYSQEGLLQDYLEDLLNTENGEIRNSLVYSHMAEVYRKINYCHAILDTIDPTDEIIHFCELIHNNEELFRKDDEGFFGGFRNYVSNVIEVFNEFLSYVDLSRVPADVIKTLTDVAYILEQFGYPFIAILMQAERYNKTLKVSELKVKMLNLVTASADIRQAMDVAYAINVMHERKGSYQKIVYQMISLCEYSTDNNVRNWLYALYYLAMQDALITTGKTYLYRMLDTIYANNNYTEGDADRLNDVRHGASLLAGVLAKKWGRTENTDRWKDLANSEEFNEVIRAYERGYLGKQ